MPAGFEARLRTGAPLVADGGMGALLQAAVPGLRCPEEANLRAPESVVSLHLGFIRAGADVIETNSFGANRHKLRALYLESELAAINEAAVKLAREAREVSGREVYIAGSIGPIGDVGNRQGDRAGIFAEQAGLLEGRGVDLIVLETFYDLDELVTAIEEVRGVTPLPIVALMSFDSDGETVGGVHAADAAERVRDLGLAAFGANHGAGLRAALRALESMSAAGTALAALPNVGLASIVGGRIVYPHATPEYFADFAAHAEQLGARLIGGCCGTTPAEIAAIREAIDQHRSPSTAIAPRPLEFRPAGAQAESETKLQQMLGAGEFVVSVELDPPRGGNAEALLAVARELAASGAVHVVDVNDNPMARARMNALLASIAIERESGLETIPHVTPRDTSVMGLQSILLGAHADGIRNVLAVTGDPPEVGDYAGARGVYEVDSIGLTQILGRLNDGTDFNGREIDAPTSFYPGVAVNPTADDLDAELERFALKIDAGAKFAMTQALFDLTFLERMLERLGGTSPIPLLVGVFYVRSHQLAQRLHNEVPGIVVPDAIQTQFRDAGKEAAAVGLALARDLVAGARDLAAGVYIIPPFRQPVAALDVL
jgi:methionine synthase I (cobalamin-dependent)/5,10-methylenetetrahydrofolate reductase